MRGWRAVTKGRALTKQSAYTNGPTPSNNNKRLEDVLEYEEVDDDLQDLLKRLLRKQPAERVTLKEVKSHA